MTSGSGRNYSENSGSGRKVPKTPAPVPVPVETAPEPPAPARGKNSASGRSLNLIDIQKSCYGTNIGTCNNPRKRIIPVTKCHFAEKANLLIILPHMWGLYLHNLSMTSRSTKNGQPTTQTDRQTDWQTGRQISPHTDPHSFHTIFRGKINFRFRFFLKFDFPTRQISRPLQSIWNGNV